MLEKIIVTAIVLTAVYFLASKLQKQASGKEGCSSCCSCDDKKNKSSCGGEK